MIETQKKSCLDKGWRIKSLGEIADITMGNSPPGDSYNEIGDGVPLINGPVEFSKGDFGLTIKSKYTTAPTKFCKKGDLLICVRGSTTGRTNIAAFDACIGRGVAAIRAKEHQQYINHFICTLRHKIFASGNGSTFPSISQDQLTNLQIPLPSLPEQRRIAAILDKAEAVLSRQQRVMERMEDFLRSVFLDMFGDPATNPKGWEFHELGKHIKFVTSGSRGWAQYYVAKGARFIRSLDVQMNQISDEEPVYVNTPSNAEANRT